MRYLLPTLLVLAGCGDRWDAQVHPDVTFPLLGLHIPLQCVECHPEGEPLDQAADTCEGCHEDVRPEPHDPEGCAECHTEDGWDELVVDHDFFPLADAHDVPCADCHVADTYEGLDPTCGSCHADERPDDHFVGQDCGDCHFATTWEDGVEIDHDFFALTNSHAVACDSCHPPGVDKDQAQPECTACHADEEPEPQHRLGEQCDGCHETTLWTDVLNHDTVFPFPHEDANSCVDCHTEVSQDTFSCVDTCHDHNQSKMADTHSGENDYVFASWACYDCHPDGGT